MDILRKALKFAKNGTKRDPENAIVYVSILDKILYFVENKVSTVGFFSLR